MYTFPVLHHVSIVIVSTAKQMFVTLAKEEDANDKKSYNLLGLLLTAAVFHQENHHFIK